MNLIGRERELSLIETCLKARKNVLIEGPVGVGKTVLALEAARRLKQKTYRIDGDSRYSEQKMSGWFDPPTVMKKGYVKGAFVPGPLIEAMQAGAVLFINELNRMPEGVQNVLLPAIDERMIIVPRLGEIRAKDGFMVIATQNPKEFVATSHLSEAVLDRFELISVTYQSEQEERSIVLEKLEKTKVKGIDFSAISEKTVTLVRMTRTHPKIRRGASVRAAISVSEIAAQLALLGMSISQAVREAASLALPTRIEIDRDLEGGVSEVLSELFSEAGLEASPPVEQKKK